MNSWSWNGQKIKKTILNFNLERIHSELSVDVDGVSLWSNQDPERAGSRLVLFSQRPDPVADVLVRIRFGKIRFFEAVGDGRQRFAGVVPKQMKTL